MKKTPGMLTGKNTMVWLLVLVFVLASVPEVLANHCEEAAQW